MWPDEGLEDEDEIVDAMIRAYAADEWDLAALRRLLDRGGRRKKGRTRKGRPELLFAFLAECGTRGAGLALSDGGPAEGGGVEVFHDGAGNAWVCTEREPSHATWLDHEEGYEPSRALPLGQLLAAWLFHDEVVARDLEEHPDVEEHAMELCPVAPRTVFTDLPW